MADANRPSTEPAEVATSDRAESTASSYFTVTTQNTERSILQSQTQDPVGPDQAQIQHSAQEPAQEPVQTSFQEPVQEQPHEPIQAPIQESNQSPGQDATLGFGPAISDAATLHDAIRAQNLDGVHFLLNQGADTEIDNEHGEKPLYHACRLDFPKAVWPLLQSGADPESFHPGFSVYSTALHWAVEHKSLQVTEALLTHGADVNTPNSNGTTALLAAIRGRDMMMIRLLLRYGADKDVSDQHGNTPIILSQGSIDIVSLLEMSQGPPTSYLGQGSRTNRTHADRLCPPIQYRDKMIACHNLVATVVEFRVGQFEESKQETVSVYELLYGTVSMAEPSNGADESGHHTFRWFHLPANNMEWVKDLLKRLMVPHDLSDKFLSDSGMNGRYNKTEATKNKAPSFMRPICHPITISPTGQPTGFKQVVAFMPYLHYEDHNRFAVAAAKRRDISSLRRRPRTKTVNEPHGPRRRINPGDPNNWRPNSPADLYGHLISGYLVPKLDTDIPPLQPRCTLDQYFYPQLDTSDRDSDQVVFRWTKRHKNTVISESPKMFMVDQLWLWVINQDTVITCASEEMNIILMPETPLQSEIQSTVQTESYHSTEQSMRSQENETPFHRTTGRRRPRRTQEWGYLARAFLPAHSLQQAQQFSPDHQEVESSGDSLGSNYSPMNIRQKIMSYLNKGDRRAIESPTQLAKKITHLCMSVFDQHEVSAEFQFFDFFEHSIGEVSNSAAELRKEFRMHIAKADHGELQDHLNIQKEADLLVEIEDIHDELIILKKILSDEKTIMQEIDKTLPSLDEMNPGDQDGDNLPVVDHSVVENHLQRVESMLGSTDKPRKTLLYLLDLKQKQASISQAKASAKYSEQQALQAKETARQGQTLMLFTVVTILFLPLSFMAAFFAIAIDAFPLDENGNLSLGYVLKYMLSISAGLSVPFIVIAFNLDRFGDWMGHVRVRLSFAAIMTLAIPVSLSVLLPAIWTSSLAHGIKLAVTIAAVLGVLICLVIAAIGKLVRMAES